jgi:N-acetyl-gamma-glutamyl-phosphate reductase
MATKVFIDGEAGTTGLQIRDKLAGRAGLQLVSLPGELRKDVAAKRELLEGVDLTILCLPDEAAKEAARLVDEMGERGPRVIDASSAHRVAPGWVYGFAEMTEEQAARIGAARRVSNPGCHATGAIALLRPLTEAGLLPVDSDVAISSISGYSGGGKSMIEAYESGRAPAFEHYALGLEHKHMPEICRYSGLAARPIFMPSVANFRQGMLVSVPLALDALPARPTGADLRGALARHYGAGGYVRVASEAETVGQGRIEPESLNGTNDLEIHVFANEARRQAVLIAKFDNLGKGASGAAVQNLELMLGI